MRVGGTAVGLAIACAGLVLAQPLLASTSAPPGSQGSADALVTKASGYVTAYQKAFAFLIADEMYVQEAALVGLTRTPGATDDQQPRRRTMRGEMFLTYLAADRRWVALHDIAEVDGVPVDDRENLRALLAVSPVQSVAARLFRHNARYNIGAIVRNFNEPTLALQVLESSNRSRFDFRVQYVDRSAPGPALVTLGFREWERPTMVRGLTGQAVFATGELFVDAETGTVRRTRIAFRHESVDAELTTTFAWHERLDLWLPAVFAERYTAGPRNGHRAETATGEARYENYRRFEGTGRIAPSSY